MKKLVTFIIIFSVFVSCQKSAVEKPDNLIEEDVMVDIIYDLAILDAIKSQNPTSLDVHGINPNEYIYKKYKIDSLQFAQNDRYYATDIKKYKKIYDEVTVRLAEQLGTPSGKQPDEQIVR